MADAWGGAWALAWGTSWQAPVAPPVVVDLRRMAADAEEFEERRQASRDELRAAIERAFAGPAEALQAEQPVVRHEIAQVVLSDIRTDGLTASIGRIERLIAEYERIQALRDEEGAIVVLLLG